MAQTTVYTCDICKQSKDENSLAKITVNAEGLKVKGIGKYSALKIDICPECLKKKGFVVETKDKDEEQAAAQNKVTLEDKLYDILEDLGVIFTE